MTKQTIFTSLFVLCILAVGWGQKKWTLAECVHHAVENSLDIKLTELGIENAEVDALDAQGARLPSANANLSHILNIGLSTNLTTGILENQTTQFSSAGLGVNWTAYNGKRNLLQLYRSNAAVLANQYQLDNMKDNIRLQVVNAYLQAVFNRENIGILKSQLENTKLDVERTNALIEAGSIAAGELFELEATIANQEQNIVNAENNLQVSLIALAQILQINDYENFDIANEDYDISDEDILAQSPKAIYDKALILRNDIKASEKNIELAEMDREIARRAAYPTLNMFYNYDTRISYEDRVVGSEIDPDQPTALIGAVEETGQSVVTPNFRTIIGSPASFFDQWAMNDGHALGLSLSVPIFDGFRIKNNVQRSEVAIKQRQIELENTKWDLENAIQQAYFDALNAKETYDATQKTTAARRKSFDFASDRFEANVINSFEYNQTRQRVIQAESEELQAKYSYLFSLKVLEFYFGLPLQVGD